MLEHRACCVDLIKFSSVLFAVGLVTQLYLYSAVCRVLTTQTQISGRAGGLGLGFRKALLKRIHWVIEEISPVCLFFTVYPLPRIPKLIRMWWHYPGCFQQYCPHPPAAKICNFVECCCNNSGESPRVREGGSLMWLNTTWTKLKFVISRENVSPRVASHRWRCLSDKEDKKR